MKFQPGDKVRFTDAYLTAHPELKVSVNEAVIVSGREVFSRPRFTARRKTGEQYIIEYPDGARGHQVPPSALRRNA